MTQIADRPVLDDRESALEYYRRALDEGRDPSARELAATFNRTDRWARGIRADVQAERDAQPTERPAEQGTVPAAPAEGSTETGTPDPTPLATDPAPAEATPETEPVPALAAPETTGSASETTGPAENLPGFAQNGPQDAPTADPRPSGHPDQSNPVQPQTAEPSAPVATLVTVPAPEPTPEESPEAGTASVPAPAPTTAPARRRGFRWPFRTDDRNATPATEPAPERTTKPIGSWPMFLLALPAFVAVWSGWVGLGEMTGFGVVHPLPGIADGFTLNTAITLPIGVEAYAAFALRVWLSGRSPLRARNFARASSVAALVLGALGQVTYHLLDAAGVTQAPWPVTTVVACLPVAVLGMGAALVHLMHD